MAEYGSCSAVFFDIGSTLVEGPDISPARYLAGVLGLPPDQRQQIARVIMCREFTDWRELCLALNSSVCMLTPEQENKIARLWTSQETAASQINGATAVVTRFFKNGFRIGLVSDIWAPYYRSFVKACPEIAGMAGCKILSFQIGERKPSTELLSQGLFGLNADPRHSIMIGDTYQDDLLPAMKLGLKTIWILCRPVREAQALNRIEQGLWPRPDITVSRISELLTMDINFLLNLAGEAG